MSFEIREISPTSPSTSVAAVGPKGYPVAAQSPTDDGDDAVAVDTMTSAPPPEVTRGIAAASSAYNELEASGRRLHFALDPTTGQLSVEVHDLDGNVQSTISPTQTLQLAGGALTL